MEVQQHIPAGPRCAANVSISAELLAEARALEINISRAAEQGLARMVAERKEEIWLAENKGALESSNAYVEQHGLPLARCRGFCVNPCRSPFAFYELPVMSAHCAS